jgi:hypothetical protein
VHARAVLEHDRGPLRVIGGPGTGKTTLLLEAVAKRVREGVDPERMLLLVGSRRAERDRTAISDHGTPSTRWARRSRSAIHPASAAGEENTLTSTDPGSGAGAPGSPGGATRTRPSPDPARLRASRADASRTAGACR